MQEHDYFTGDRHQLSALLTLLFILGLIGMGGCQANPSIPMTVDQGLATATLITIEPTPTLFRERTIETPPSTLTLSPTPALTSPSEMAQITPSQEQEGSYFLERFIGVYGFIPLKVPPIFLDTRFSDDIPGPADANHFAFANFTNQIAYWLPKDYGELWIAESAFSNAKKIFTDTQGNYPFREYYYPSYEAHLTWAPDDLHVIVYNFGGKGSHLIYHLQSNQMEPWPYICDRIGISSSSGHVAVWCPSLDTTDRYAVIEWGGEIWISDTAPVTIFAQIQPADTAEALRLIPWAWSRDGQWVAYLNSVDGFLHVLKADGTYHSTLLPEAGNWLHEKRWMISSPVVNWAFEGNHLLIFANTALPNGCPPWYSSTGQVFTNEPCWQVLDILSGEIQWTVNDLISSINQPSEAYTPINFRTPYLFPNGKNLAIAAEYSGNKSFFVIELGTKQILSRGDFGVDQMQWGIYP